ncbi:MAG: YfmQ family protein [Solibacillus sp.]
MFWIIVITVLFFTMFTFLFNAPSSLVSWTLKKFALTSKLDAQDVSLTFNGKQLEEHAKSEFIDYFNEAYILKRHFILKGNEQLFLNPETTVTPFILTVKKGGKIVNFSIYCSDDTIEVVKQHKKKVESYSLSSEDLKVFTLHTNGLS